jgi:preprotein translocase subunit SecA
VTLVQQLPPDPMTRPVATNREPDAEATRPRRAVAAARSGATSTAARQGAAPARTRNKVGRNDPCPCGSGKKYKHCHGA